MWLEGDTSSQAFEAFHERIMTSPGKRALLFEKEYHVASGGVATISPATALAQRCSSALRPEDLLDGYSATLSAVSCQAASFQIAFDLELRTMAHDVSLDTLHFGGFDRRAWSRSAIRLVAPPQLVRGVRFDLGCERYTSGTSDPRCPSGGLSPTMTP
jgi:hypothetical protein